MKIISQFLNKLILYSWNTLLENQKVTFLKPYMQYSYSCLLLSFREYVGGMLASRFCDLRIFSRRILYFGGFQKLTCTTFKVKGTWKVIYANFQTVKM